MLLEQPFMSAQLNVCSIRTPVLCGAGQVAFFPPFTRFSFLSQGDISTMESISMNRSRSETQKMFSGSSLVAETPLQTSLVRSSDGLKECVIGFLFSAKPVLLFVLTCLVLPRPLQQIRLATILSSTVDGGTTADRGAVRWAPRFSEASAFLRLVLASHRFKQVRITLV